MRAPGERSNRPGRLLTGSSGSGVARLTTTPRGARCSMAWPNTGPPTASTIKSKSPSIRPVTTEAPGISRPSGQPMRVAARPAGPPSSPTPPPAPVISTRLPSRNPPTSRERSAVSPASGRVAAWWSGTASGIVAIHEVETAASSAQAPRRTRATTPAPGGWTAAVGCCGPRPRRRHPNPSVDPVWKPLEVEQLAAVQRRRTDAHDRLVEERHRIRDGGPGDGCTRRREGQHESERTPWARPHRALSVRLPLHTNPSAHVREFI